MTEVADAIRRRRISSVEVTQACIDQARRVQPKPAAPQEQPQPERKQPPGKMAPFVSGRRRKQTAQQVLALTQTPLRRGLFLVSPKCPLWVEDGP